MMSYDRKKLTDAFPDWAAQGGIFEAMSEFNPPWLSEYTTLPPFLDLEYFGNISGEKYISPLVEKILNGRPNLTAADVSHFAEMILALNSPNWSKEWDTLFFEYNPINNYDMTETETEETETTGTGTSTRTLTRDVDSTSTSDTTNKVYAFNATTATNSDAQTQTVTNDTGETGEDTETREVNDTGTKDRTLTRSGNIGVTTSQQMLQSERDLWVWNYFYNIVFPAVDKVLTIQIY